MKGVSRGELFILFEINRPLYDTVTYQKNPIQKRN